MGSGSGSSLTETRKLEIKKRLEAVGVDIVCQLRIITDLEEGGHSAVAAKTVLDLMLAEQKSLKQELGAQAEASRSNKPGN